MPIFKKKSLSYTMIFSLFLLLLVIWGFREIVFRSMMLDSMGPWMFAFFESLQKMLIWTLPSLLLIHYHESQMVFSLGDLFTTKMRWKNTLIILGCFLLLHGTLALLSHGTIAINPDLQLPTLIEVVLFAGITEELVFRGFFLNALLKKLRPWPAVLITSVMFVLIHFPIWIHGGLFENPMDVLTNGAAIFALSLIFGWSLIKTKNILAPIVLHMAWNLILSLLYI